MPQQPFVKVFATPGIDSDPSEQGVFNSGAGLHPHTQTLKTKPYDWLNESREQGYGAGFLVGAGDTNSQTKSKQANQLSVRRRGIAPWGGFFKGGRAHSAMQHRGGIVDSNTGASGLIAGGPGQASTLVRVQGGRVDRNMKLPVLPTQTKRGGVAPMPQGGGSHDPLTAPLKSNVPGFPSIFMFRNRTRGSR
jgi:hypothetical protein